MLNVALEIPWNERECAMNKGTSWRRKLENKYESSFEGRHNPA
jgi:hypothetical protein